MTAQSRAVSVATVEYPIESMTTAVDARQMPKSPPVTLARAVISPKSGVHDEVDEATLLMIHCPVVFDTSTLMDDTGASETE